VVLTPGHPGGGTLVGVTDAGNALGAHWQLAGGPALRVLTQPPIRFSVIATVQEAGVLGGCGHCGGRKPSLNDSTAAVGSGAIALATGAAITPPGSPSGFLAVTIVGGVACGEGAWQAAVLATWPAVTEDPLVEITFTTLLRTAPFGWRIPGRVRGAGHPHRGI